MARNFAAELSAAREAGDWAAHERIWEERRVGSVEADEAQLEGEYAPGDKVIYRGALAEVDCRYENSGDYLILCADGLYRQANPLALSRPAGSPDQTAERSALVGGAQLPGAAQTLEQQLDALIAEHGLSSVSIARIAHSDGDGSFWAINAQGSGYCGSNGYDRGETAAQGLANAISDLNTLRCPAVVVPDLELAA